VINPEFEISAEKDHNWTKLAAAAAKWTQMAQIFKDQLCHLAAKRPAQIWQI